MWPSPGRPRDSSTSGPTGEPVADLLAGDPAAEASSGDHLGQGRVPPDVVGVNHDTDALGRELFGDVERLTESGHHTTVGREHRVHRLDRQHHPSRPDILDEFPDRVAGPLPGAGQVPVTGRKPPATRTSTGAEPGAPAAASAAVSSIARRSSARAADRADSGER